MKKHCIHLDGMKQMLCDTGSCMLISLVTARRCRTFFLCLVMGTSLASKDGAMGGTDCVQHWA